MLRLVAVLLLGLATVAVHAEALDRNIAATKEDQVRELLSEAVRNYRVGRYDEAALRLRDALGLQPDNKLVYDFYLAMGDRLLIAMSERAELEDVMKDVLRRARIYQRELRSDPRYIELLISKLAASERERLAATTELVAIGPLAVPHLVARIGAGHQDDQRLWVRSVLTRMGYRAVIPLCEALNAEDDRLVQTVAVILADIGDPRALPHLQRLIEADDTPEVVNRMARNGVAAIAARSGIAELPSATMLFFREALRYFRDGDQVRDEMVANQSLMWRWQQGAGSGAQLQHQQAPRYAWNELMAEELIFKGMAAGGDASFQPLLAAVLAAQEVEVSLRQRLAADAVRAVLAPDEQPEALRERAEALAEMRDRVKMFGARQLLRAVQQAVVSERYDVAGYLFDVLSDPFLVDAENLLPAKVDGLVPGKPGSVLVAALEHPEKRVRYHAAVTLARIDPKMEFFNSEKVIALLAEAVGEWGMVSALVVEPDFRHRNAAREALLGEGLLAFTAGDGFEARSRIAETPVKDVILVAGDLTPALRDEHGQLIDVPEQSAAGLIEVLSEDPRTAQTPILVILPEDQELAATVQSAFAGQVAGFVHRPHAGAELKGRIEQALGDAELPDVNRQERESISLAAAKALAGIDPVHTQFDLRQAAAALAGAIKDRADPIRIAALEALGRSGDSERIGHVLEVYRSQAAELTGKPAVRAAFMRCIGLLDPSGELARDIIAEALRAPQIEVRQAAAAAVGHGGAAMSDEDRARLLVQQRLDVRAAGAGAQQ